MPDKTFIGLMSGTSMDGVDVVATRFNNAAPIPIESHHHPYPDALLQQLRSIITPEWKGSLSTMLQLDFQVGQHFARAAEAVIQKLPAPPTAIGMHGQTIHHLPSSNTPSSWQLGNAAVVAEITQTTTIADWRRRDMAAGGQGAPLTPAFHRHFIRNGEPCCVLNLGGIANISALPANLSADYFGFDTGPANTLMDLWISHHKGLDYDAQGSWAATGKIITGLLDQMLTDPYFALPPPKSTGLEYFNLAWLEKFLSNIQSPDPSDVQRTLLELTAVTISKSVKQFIPESTQVYVCGGGIHNCLLLERLQQLMETQQVQSSATIGLDPDLMEATAFAWFAQETLAGRAIDVSPVTGAAGARILGAIYLA